MRAELVTPWRFFCEHAGGIVGRNAATAITLARAELWARAEEDAGRLRFRWEYDPEPYETDIPGDEPSEVLGCILERRCTECEEWRHAQSLWGIGDPSPEYRRVVEAELACEEMP